MASALIASSATTAMHGVCRGQYSRPAPQPTLALLPAPLPFRQRSMDAGALHSKPFLSGASLSCGGSAQALSPCAPRQSAHLELDLLPPTYRAWLSARFDGCQTACCQHEQQLLSLPDTQADMRCTLRAGSSVVRYNERPGPRPLAAVRPGNALTLEANLFSRFARVLRATFFFYGDAAGTAVTLPVVPCGPLRRHAEPDASCASRQINMRARDLSRPCYCLSSDPAQRAALLSCPSVPCVARRRMCCMHTTQSSQQLVLRAVSRGEDPVRMLDSVVDEMQGDLIRMRQTAAQVR